MALHGKFGKDAVPKSNEAYIAHALHGGDGHSNGLHHYPVDRKDQSILTALPSDNVKLAMEIPSSILDTGVRGGTRNLEHSLEGCKAPADGDVGAAGHVRHIVIPNH
jgi:hypothetical protein